MTLYLIGIGLSTEKDITVKGMEIVKECDLVYLESYTSLLQCSVEDLEQFYGKKVIIAEREITEQGTQKIIEQAKDKDVAFLVVGDPFSATTHIELFKSAKENNVPVKVIHNASILTAVGMTGLQLYKFGKITSIPFQEEQPNLETPYNVLKENQEMGLHTLFLLDLKPEEEKFMTIKDALDILEKIEEEKKDNIIKKETIAVGCARLGSNDLVIKAGNVDEIKQVDFGRAPHCLIIPGKLHFMEKEMLELWRIQ